MREATVTVQGLRELRQTLLQLPDHVQRRLMRRALKAALEPVKNDVLHRVPVRTGWLQSRIAIVPASARKSDDTAMSVAVTRDPRIRITKSGRKLKPPAVYARFLEFGTRFMPARPFMRGSIKRNLSEVLRIYRMVLRQGINTYIARRRRRRSA